MAGLGGQLTDYKNRAIIRHGFGFLKRSYSMTLISVWIFFGLLNFYVMKKADGVSGDNPPHGTYWLKGREFFGFISSILGGPIVIPFTIWAFRDWRRLSRTRSDVVDKSTSTWEG